MNEEQDPPETIHDVRAAQAGERDATERLFERYAPRLRTIVALQLGSSAGREVEVEDVVQEALLRAFEHIDRYEERDDATFRSWLARIALNLIRDNRRKQQRQKRGEGRVQAFRDAFDSSMLEPGIPAGDPSPTQFARVRELEDAEREAIEKLSGRQREVVLMRDFAGMEYAEIAEEMDFDTEAPVRALYSRARQRIRELMQPFDDQA